MRTRAHVSRSLQTAGGHREGPHWHCRDLLPPQSSPRPCPLSLVSQEFNINTGEERAYDQRESEMPMVENQECEDPPGLEKRKLREKEDEQAGKQGWAVPRAGPPAPARGTGCT